MYCGKSVRFGIVSLSVLVAMVAVGCNSSTSIHDDFQVDLTFQPSPPVVGDIELNLKLADANGSSLSGANVKLEGNMNHAGMKPSFAELSETEPGRYTGTMELTMGGDWFILVTATTADGTTLERKIDLPGVQAE